MGVVVDTSVLIAVEKGRFGLDDLWAAAPGEPFVIAAVTASELLHGVARAAPERVRERRRHFVERVLETFPVVGFGLQQARVHAWIWADLASQGQPVGPYDLLVAATALAAGFALASFNRKEFSRVPDLVLLTLPASPS